MFVLYVNRQMHEYRCAIISQTKQQQHKKVATNNKKRGIDYVYYKGRT